MTAATPVFAASPVPSPVPSPAASNPTSLPATPGPERSTPNSTVQGPQPQPQQSQQEKLTRAVTPSRSPSLNMFEFDPRNVLSQFSPAQFQQLLASLASQNLSDPTMTSAAPPASTVNPNATNMNTESNLTPYHQPSFDFSQPTSNFGYPFIAPEAMIPFGPYDPSSSSLTTMSANSTGTTNPGDMNLTLLDSASSQEQREHEERMAKEWETAEIMEDNVNGLDSRIHSLAQALGLDPALLDNDNIGGGRTAGGAENDDENDDGMNELQMGLQGQQFSTATGTTEVSSPTATATATTTTTTTPAAPTVDFDFDSFFNSIGSSTTGIGSDLDSGMDFPSTTFLDEVPTPASSTDQTASPVLPLKQDVTPEMPGVGSGSSTFAGGGGGPAKGTRKRKSELAMDLDIPETTTPATKTTTTTTTATATGGNKSKRRKDK